MSTQKARSTRFPFASRSCQTTGWLTGSIVGLLVIGLSSPATAQTKPANTRLNQAKTAVELPDPNATAPAATTSTSTAAQPTAAASNKMSEITEADGTTVILPPGYEAGKPYPALVLMPYTNRTALHMFNWGIYDAYHQQADSFIIIMPPGQGSSANWSGWGWESLVSEYEAYVQQDLSPIVEKYNVDPEKLVIGGFSLGGDLSWTLSLRNPDIFSGAIVLGSMSNYRDEQNAQQLAASGFRYFMVMGGYDGNKGSMYNALDTLDNHNITYHYEEVGSAGHGDLPEQMQRDLFLSAMDYVLAAF